MEKEKHNDSKNIEKKTDIEELNEVEKFKKGKFSKVLLFFFGISIITFFIGNGFILKLLSFIQAVLFIVSWLMGMQIIKEKFKDLKIILAIVAFVLIVPILGNIGSKNNNYENINWNSIVMKKVLPKPSGNKGKIYSNSEEHLSIYIVDSSVNDFNKYLEECKKKGFTLESKIDNDSYDAFNKNGYKLRISYSEYSKEYSITVNAPKKMTKNVWPNSTLSNMLPKPDSIDGLVQNDSANNFTYYAGNTTIEQFKLYVEKVKAAGFIIDYSNAGNTYSAKNQNAYKVLVAYEGGNTMKIELSKPSETSSNQNSITKPSNDSLRQDFKKAMDSYEAFMDEYISFMKKYKDNPTDSQILSSYANYMKKYTQAMRDFENWKSNTINTTEANYYIEVQTRINKKLIEIN
jgi:conserved uncharacterized protein